MTTTNGNRKILDQKRWEFCTPAPVATAAGALIISSRHYRQQQLYVQAATVAYIYKPEEDGWVQVPSPALGTAIAAGACGVAVAVGPTGTASAGSTSTITTGLNIQRDLRGYSIHITGGTNNKGVTLAIVSNTVGANSVITVATQASAFDATTTFRLLTPRWYVLAPGTLVTASFRYFDFALNTWTSGATITGLPATIGTDARMLSTPSWMDTDYLSFATGTATAGGASTLTNGAKSWATNQWANYQVRIVSGTGAGQIRTIASNTGTVLTTSAAWTTNPDATSVYSIEGNDDFLYVMGNNAVTLYRYSISGGTWSTLSPGVARSGAPSTGMSGHWIWGCTETDWTSESAIKNGRYLYSFRGGAGALLDAYDIAANSWAAIAYSPATETLTTGTKWVYNADALYIQKDATGRWFRYDIPRSSMDGWGSTLYTQGAAVLGDTAFDATFFDGATKIPFVYFLLNTQTVMLRQMVI